VSDAARCRPARILDEATHGSDSLMNGDIILNLDGIAEKCGVSRLVARTWIDRGLKAFPLGAEGRYHARDYLVREAWLIEFLESNAIRRNRAATDNAATPEKAKQRRPRAPEQSPEDDWIGPCPV
jgi:hypothetical protein